MAEAEGSSELAPTFCECGMPRMLDRRLERRLYCPHVSAHWS
jgi:hypothetical protein